MAMGRRKDLRARVLGPYPHHRGWRCIVIRGDGSKRPRPFATREEADTFIATFHRTVSSIVHTTETAREAFVKAMTARKLSARTIEGYNWAVKTFWPTPRPLRAMTPENCLARYKELATSSFSVDSHRNALKMVKTFLRWCVGEAWLAENPLEKVSGSGKRNKRKPQLRLDEARKLYTRCLEQAIAGDPGATAALMCLLLTLRSESEALAVRARDVDDDGWLLWVDDSKTEAGRRVEEVPEDFRPALLSLKKDKQPEEHLFRRRDRKWLWDEVERLCREAGVPRVSPHGLRGMHATLARRGGATSRMVADALGHASERVTEDHYIAQGEGKAADRERVLKLIKGGR